MTRSCKLDVMLILNGHFLKLKNLNKTGFFKIMEQKLRMQCLFYGFNTKVIIRLSTIFSVENKPNFCPKNILTSR